MAVSLEPYHWYVHILYTKKLNKYISRSYMRKPLQFAWIYIVMPEGEFIDIA